MIIIFYDAVTTNAHVFDLKCMHMYMHNHVFMRTMYAFIYTPHFHYYNVCIHIPGIYCL